jgi:hypothetical protein
MLFLPSFASCRLLSARVNLKDHVPVMSGDEGPHIELPSGMKAKHEARLLTHEPNLIREDLLEVLPIEHSAPVAVVNLLPNGSRVSCGAPLGRAPR